MVRQRVIIGTILIAAVIGLFWLDARLATVATAPLGASQLVNWAGLALHGGLITLVAAALVLAATAETVQFCRSAGMNPSTPWALSISVLMTISPWIAQNVRGLSADSLGLIILVVGLIGSAGAIMTRRRTDGAIQNIASTWFSATYLGFLASFAVRIRLDVPGALGAWVILWFIVCRQIHRYLCIWHWTGVRQA